MAKKGMEWFDWLAFVLLVVGGINWGLAIWDYNLVATIFGKFANIVYGVVGLSGLYGAYMLYKLAN